MRHELAAKDPAPDFLGIRDLKLVLRGHLGQHAQVFNAGARSP
jgi:hypothetical protein